MKLDGAKFLNFRNIESVSFEFDPEMNIIFGKNAQGKTNVIEGIYLFAGGKSFRRASDADMRRFGSDFSQLAVKFSSAERSYEMGIRCRENGRREMFKNGARVARVSDFVGTFRAVLFCPSHLSIVQSEPSVRRSFFDGAISQMRPRYLSSLIEYGKVIEQKNALLRSFDEKPEGFDDMYDILSERAAELGGYITSVRAVYLSKLFSYVDELLFDMSGEHASYEYKSSVSGDGDLTSKPENARRYREKTALYREREIAAKTSLVGAHRDDFDIFLGGRAAKIFASQGQQRSIALALKLAEGEISREECGEYPVFLLDDVLSELDRDRKNYVLSRLGGRQVIITSCDESDFAGISSGKRIFVKAGKYTEM